MRPLSKQQKDLLEQATAAFEKALVPGTAGWDYWTVTRGIAPRTVQEMRLVEEVSSDLVDRLSSRFELDETGCWVWTGYVGHSGYGQLEFRGKKYTAHRVVYESAVGEVPPGLVLDHLCRNRACVNPDHLEPVTHRVNILRGVSPSADHARMTHCTRGHELTPENLYIRSCGRRACRPCTLQRNREYVARRRAKGAA